MKKLEFIQEKEPLEGDHGWKWIQFHVTLKPEVLITTLKHNYGIINDTIAF
jgi:hypothetical protein